MTSNLITRLFEPRKWPRFDLAVILTVIALCTAIALILWHGDPTNLQVNHFSWAGEKIGVQDRYFTLGFNRPVERKSVEENLVIEPPLPGTMSWRGNRLFYTLTELPFYDTQYKVQLVGAKERFSENKLNFFNGVFYTHDRVFAYIGLQGTERGKLILCQLKPAKDKFTIVKKTVLTPSDLVVTNFRIYPEGNKILFSAFDPYSGGLEVPRQQLFTVTTGINFKTTEEITPSGRIKKLLDAQTYQNLKFDLSSNGKTIVVQRVNYNNPADAGLWIILENGELRPLGIRGDEFLISPNGQKVAVSQPGGVAILPLTPDGGAPQFLPGYEKILDFNQNGTEKVIVKVNPDYSRSLYLINDANELRGLFRTTNSVLGCQFEPRQEKTLYCLKTDLVIGEDNRIKEEPYLTIVDIATGQDLPLLALPNYQDVQMSLSPDGVALLFDQVVAVPMRENNDLMSREGQAIANGQLWILSLPQTVNFNITPKIISQELNAGFKPRWFP
ncbi:hypothetical protein C7H19_11275 [Aphanothece hegewaldii CCALA 016]|uniref:SbsA Ig-like domain-containing protein n=1 Tax=Aphanothece hegewaldii CCALA 016 TaxID=2107694 RepID=A0A2T1LY61_9CHRO|nr:hypothetical protein [Aphanothece hegewaldii]PSF37291.1 hypothetical protein C7H19_11275 [Aphanothece hegewaldii CCALA 016]